MGVRRDMVVLRHFQPEHKHTVVARIAVEHCRLCASRHGRRRGAPLHLLRRDHLVVAGMLRHGGGGQDSKTQDRDRGDDFALNHVFLLWLNTCFALLMAAEKPPFHPTPRTPPPPPPPPPAPTHPPHPPPPTPP